MFSLLQSISFVLVIIFLTYVAFILVPYLRQKATPPGDPDSFLWHTFIPCRDEQSVIAATIAHSRETFPEMHVWVIDDDSDDETAAIVQAHADADPFVHLVQRRRPEARTGKGDALNAAFAELDAWLPEDTDRSTVIIAVVDADGALAPNALAAVSADKVFADPEVGAAQLAVHMKNRDDTRPLAGKGRIANAFSSWLLRLPRHETSVSNDDACCAWNKAALIAQLSVTSAGDPESGVPRNRGRGYEAEESADASGDRAAR